MQDYKSILEEHIEIGINRVIQEKSVLKTNTSNKTSLDYKNTLKRLNSDLAKSRRIKNKLLKQLENPSDVACKAVETTLDVLQQLNYKAVLVPVSGLKSTTYTKRVIK
jgi:hypothetical protein